MGVRGVRGLRLWVSHGGRPGSGPLCAPCPHSPGAQAAPAVGAGAYPEPGEEIKRFSCQRVLPFYGFWPCPLVLTQPPSGSLCCGPAPRRLRGLPGRGCCGENPGLGGGMLGRLEFLKSWDQPSPTPPGRGPGWPRPAPARVRPQFPSQIPSWRVGGGSPSSISAQGEQSTQGCLRGVLSATSGHAVCWKPTQIPASWADSFHEQPPHPPHTHIFPDFIFKEIITTAISDSFVQFQ